jgi:hypothetical protein
MRSATRRARALVGRSFVTPTRARRSTRTTAPALFSTSSRHRRIQRLPSLRSAPRWYRFRAKSPPRLGPLIPVGMLHGIGTVQITCYLNSTAPAVGPLDSTGAASHSRCPAAIVHRTLPRQRQICPTRSVRKRCPKSLSHLHLDNDRDGGRLRCVLAEGTPAIP